MKVSCVQGHSWEMVAQLGPSRRFHPESLVKMTKIRFVDGWNDERDWEVETDVFGKIDPKTRFVEEISKFYGPKTSVTWID